jgi:hypothetical protein
MNRKEFISAAFLKGRFMRSKRFTFDFLSFDSRAIPDGSTQEIRPDISSDEAQVSNDGNTIPVVQVPTGVDESVKTPPSSPI